MIGFRAHDLGAGDFEYFENVIKKIADLGYQSLQLAPAKSIVEIDGLEGLNIGHLEKIKAILNKHDIKVSVLGCYVNLTAEEEKIRISSVETFKRYISFAKFLDAGMIATETTYGVIKDETREKAMEQVINAIKDIIQVAKREDVIVAIEPVSDHALNSPELTRRLLDEINSPQLKVLYDQSNLLSASMLGQDEEMFRRAIASFGEDVVALHMKNFVVVDDKKEMVALADGGVDLARILNYAASCLRDVHIIREDPGGSDIKEDLAFIKRHYIT